MAEIKQYPKDRIVVIEFSDDELDQLLEVAKVQGFSLNEVILAAFKIGIIQLVAKTMRDKLPEEKARLYGTDRFDQAKS